MKGRHNFVDNYIRTCHTHQRVKSEMKSSRGKIQPLMIPERKWQTIHMDLVLGLPPWPPNVGTYDVVLTITDRATKMVHFVATSRTEKATDTARYFIQHGVKTHGLPRSVICDRDSKFLSLFWQTVMQFLGVSARTTSGFHPQENGLAKRTNQTLRQYIRGYAKQSDDWPAGLATAEMAINNAPIEGRSTVLTS